MSKIICDVCGTSYPDSSTQCPICGCVRPVDAAAVTGDNGELDTHSTATYTYVKGGRFSRSNVKKRNRADQVTPAEPVLQTNEPEVPKEKSDKGLIITVCVLLVAIIAVVIYIAVHFFAPGRSLGNAPDAGTTGNTDASSTVGTTEDTTVPEIPCVDIVVSKTVIELDKEGAAHLLNITTNPGNTTDTILFSSSDEAVATVTEDGKIVAVGGGDAVITITCGDATAECHVVCNIEAETTEPDETESVTVPASEFKLNREDFTLDKKGATWVLYKGDIPVKQITWTSDDEKVATIEDGVVTAVGSGNTKVYGEYNGTKLSCVVRCTPAVGKAEENPAETEETTRGTYNISSTDVTLYLDSDKSFDLKLLDADRKAVSVIWSIEDESICTASGNTITAVAAGVTTVSVTYEGETYSCTVRVRDSK